MEGWTNRLDETIYPFGIMNLNIRVEVQVDPNVDGLTDE